MKIIYVDTDILIDLSRGRQKAVDFLDGLLNKAILKISIITAMELLVGCRNKKEQKEVEVLLSKYEVSSLDQTIAQRAFELIKSYILSHSLLIPDALIAATVLQDVASLATLNDRHFSMIPRLEVLRPY